MAAHCVLFPELEEIATPDCEWSAFMRENGRVPLITDPRKPWDYKGWLLYYRTLLEGHPDVNKRWSYWFRVMEAGRILSDPIPRIDFDMGAMDEKAEGFKAVNRWIEIVDREGITWSPVRELVSWFLWGFGLSKDPPRLKEKTLETLYREVNLGVLLVRPYDYFGEWISVHKGKYNPTAFFPTPHCVVEMMTQMNFYDAMDTKQVTVCDPCTGSGRFLLHASNHSLRLYGCDIDPLMVDVAKINGALYVPWLVRPFPDHFFSKKENVPVGLEVRDSIRNPVGMEKR